MESVHPTVPEFPSGSPDDREAVQLLSLVMDKNGLEDKATVDPRKYKTQLCRNWASRRECPYADTCSFAHGPEELRRLADNHALLASIGYFSNVVLLAMSNGKRPALPPHCLYQQPPQFPVPQTAEELQQFVAMAPAGKKFPYQRPLISALRELRQQQQQQEQRKQQQQQQRERPCAPTAAPEATAAPSHYCPSSVTAQHPPAPPHVAIPKLTASSHTVRPGRRGRQRRSGDTSPSDFLTASHEG